MESYIKLYRKIRNTSVWCDSDKLKLWLYCLTEASYEDRTILHENKKIDLKKGQFITGRNKLEMDFNKGVKNSAKISGSTLVRWLELFEKCEMLHIEKTNKYSVVTVLNWDKYQQNEQQMNNSCTHIKKYKKYSKDLKQQAVLDYLAGRGSQDDICKKYGIRSKAKLQIWIKKYNGYEELKSSGTGGNAIMTKGRKTTFEERVEIVQYCIAHDRNYAKTAEQYQVSYQQARSYTVKYETGGVEALRDNRGKRKSPDEMNELEKLRAEVKILKAEKERAEMETSFLKKLDEIERRRG